MTKRVDSYKFISGITKRMVKSWIAKEPAKPIPWLQMSKPLSDSVIALVSSGGIALKSDVPFDQEGERQNPWWGDTSYRIIPRDTTEKEARKITLIFLQSLLISRKTSAICLALLEEIFLQNT